LRTMNALYINSSRQTKVGRLINLRSSYFPKLQAYRVSIKE
jgi:hypothetical protein